MTRIVFVLLLVVVSIPVAEADVPFVTKSYEIGAIVESASEPETGHIGLPVPITSTPIREWDPQDARYIGPDELESWLRERVRPKLWSENEFASLQVIGNRMLVTAPASAHAEVEAFLARRWQEAVVRIRVDVDWVRLEGAPSPELAKLVDEARRGGLPVAQGTALLQAAKRTGGRVSSASAQCRPNLHAAVRQTRRTSYVGDFAIEIAQEATIADPIIEDALGGWSLDLRPFVLRDGSVVIESLLQHGELNTPIRRLPLDTPPVGTIDLPRMAIQRVATTTRMQAGTARTWVLEREGKTSVVLVRAACAARPPPETNGRRSIDVGAILANPATFAVRLDDDNVTSFQHPIVMLVASGEHPRGDHIEDLINPVSEDETGVEVVESLLFIDGEAPTVRRAEAWVRSLEQTMFERKRVDFTLVRRTGDRRNVIARTGFDVTLGRATCMQDGTEHAYVADWEVEVAQDARAGDPVPAVLFEGWIVNARADAVPGGKHVMLNLDVEYTDTETPFEIRRPKNEATGPIEMPRVVTAQIAREISLELGVTKTLDVGSVTGGNAPSRLELEVTIGD